MLLYQQKDNAKLSKLLGARFKRLVYWNKYKVIDNKVVEIAANNGEKYIRELLDSSYQRVKRLFVLVYDNTAVMIKFLMILLRNIFFQELK